MQNPETKVQHVSILNRSLQRVLKESDCGLRMVKFGLWKPLGLETSSNRNDNLNMLFMLILQLGRPGRTFLGKRRYFSGIAALTPLTPLTYKQNAVNAFIPTKKTPLTPLYRQGTPLTLLYQKKLVSSKNWFSHSVKNEKLTVNHLLDKRLRSF